MKIFPFYFNNIDDKYLNKKKSDWVNSYKPKRKLMVIGYALISMAL